MFTYVTKGYILVLKFQTKNKNKEQERPEREKNKVKYGPNNKDWLLCVSNRRVSIKNIMICLGKHKKMYVVCILNT